MKIGFIQPDCLPEGVMQRSLRVLKRHPGASAKYGLTPGTLLELKTHINQHGPALFALARRPVARQCATVFALARFLDPCHLDLSDQDCYAVHQEIRQTIGPSNHNPQRCESLRRVVDDDTKVRTPMLSNSLLTYDSVFKFLTKTNVPSERVANYSTVMKVLTECHLDVSIADAVIDAYRCDPSEFIRDRISEVLIKYLPQYGQTVHLIPILMTEPSFLNRLLVEFRNHTKALKLRPDLVWWQNNLAPISVVSLAASAETDVRSLTNLIGLAEVIRNPRAVEALRVLDPTYYVRELSRRPESALHLGRPLEALEEKFGNRQIVAQLKKVDASEIVQGIPAWSSAVIATLKLLLLTGENESVLEVYQKALPECRDDRTITDVVFALISAVDRESALSQRAFLVLVELARKSPLVRNEIRKLADWTATARRVHEQVKSYDRLEQQFPNLRVAAKIFVD